MLPNLFDRIIQYGYYIGYSGPKVLIILPNFYIVYLNFKKILQIFIKDLALFRVYKV